MRLEDDLRDLVEDVPRFVRVDAHGAWAAARRRRLRRTAAVVGALVLLAALSASGLRALTRTVAIDPAGGESVGGTALQLPRRIDHPIGPVDDLPRRAGRIAGVVHRTDADTNDAGWFAVSPTGHLWRLPKMAIGDFPPAVSADGSTLGYLQQLGDGHSRYLVWDLARGVITFYSTVGTGDTLADVPVDPMTRYWVNSQSPAWFSPDGSAVVVMGGPIDRTAGHTRALLLSGGGVSAFGDSGSPAGWLDESHVVWVDGPQALVTDVSGRVLRTVDLDVGSAEGEQWGQWVGPVSAGSGLLAAGDAVFSLGGDRPGRRVELPRIQGIRAETCPAAEAAIDPIVAVQGGGGVLLERSPGERVVVADPHLGIDCSVWAADALHAPRHASLSSRIWGDSTGWLSWWWRETAAGVAVAVVAGVLLMRWRRRRRLRSSP